MLVGDEKMKISALTSSLPNPLADAISILASEGFQWIDVPPTAGTSDRRQQINDLGLQIGCVGLEREMPGARDLASQSRAERDAAVSYFRRALDATAELGAPAGYLTPPTSTDDAISLAWNSSIDELAEHAAQCSVDLCIEHFPNRLLPTGAGTLKWLEDKGHPSLKLLIDVGHAMISHEAPAELIRAAGDRLGYLHFDDNDGEDDRHWGLLKGICTEEILRSTITAAAECGYGRCLCLEFNPELDEPLKTLTDGKGILERCL